MGKLLLKVSLAILICAGLVTGVCIFRNFGDNSEIMVTNYEECKERGYSIVNNNPKKCITPEGVVYEDIVIFEGIDVVRSDSCENASGCKISGCNSNFCINKDADEIITTCEISDELTPIQRGLECKCEEGMCQWD